LVSAHCPKCGVELPADPAKSRDLNFCPSCGFNLHEFAPHPSDDLEAEIGRMLAAGDYILAIKRRREITGEGLKDAKDWVDDLAKRRGVAAQPADSAKGRFAWRLGVGAFLALMICSAGIAIFPKLGYVAKPFLCGGELSYQTEKLHRLPGQSGAVAGVSRSFTCPDGTDVSCFTLLISWPIYTVILVLLFYIRGFWKRRDDRPGPTT
jgi:hypothetical protein